MTRVSTTVRTSVATIALVIAVTTGATAAERASTVPPPTTVPVATAAPPTPLAPTTSPPPTAPAGTTPDFVLPVGWTTLIDSTNTISIAVPFDWSDIDLAPESNPDGTLVPSIEAAATDIGVFTDTFDEPGIFFRAFAYSDDTQAMMDRFGLTGGCRDRDIVGYDDGAFSGLHATWTNCGSTLDPEWHQVVASPASKSFTIVLQIQITSDTQQSLVDTVMASFNFTPQGGSATGPSPPPTVPGQPMTTAAPTTTLFATPSGTVPSDARPLSDDLGVISLAVPAGWTDVRTRTFTGGGLTDAPYIAASTDLASFIPADNASDTYTVQGVYALGIPYTADIDAAMSEWGTVGDCRFSAPQPYSNGGLSGLTRVASACGGTTTRIVTVVANPVDASYTAVLLLQLNGQGDALVYDTVLSSFRFSPASAGPPTEPSTGAGVTTTSTP